MTKTVTLSISPETLRELLVSASYYLGGEGNKRIDSNGRRKEVTNIKGTFDELTDEIDAMIERGEV